MSLKRIEADSFHIHLCECSITTTILLIFLGRFSEIKEFIFAVYTFFVALVSYSWFVTAQAFVVSMYSNVLLTVHYT